MPPHPQQVQALTPPPDAERRIWTVSRHQLALSPVGRTWAEAQVWAASLPRPNWVMRMPEPGEGFIPG